MPRGGPPGTGRPRRYGNRPSAVGPNPRATPRFESRQTAFGRTGEHYWGFEHCGGVPDMVTMAKGLGNGAPTVAVATRMDIARALTHRLHFNAFDGNPVSMAASLAVLDIVDEEGLQANSKARGAEFVHDSATRLPAKQEAVDVMDAARQMGLLLGKGLGKGGIDSGVLRITPSMCTTADDVEFTGDVVERAAGQVA